MAGLQWKRNSREVVDRRRRFFKRRMQDGILATLPVAVDTREAWEAFDRRWGVHGSGERRRFPSNEEIFERERIGIRERGGVEDDHLPVVYSTLDAGDSMVCALFGHETEYIHRPHAPAISLPACVLPDYRDLDQLKFSLDDPWPQRLLSIISYFEEHTGPYFAQHPCLTMDALNFVCEMRGATRAYLDVYEYPDELRRLMEIGRDFNIRFQDAQRAVIAPCSDGCFVWLAGWTPFHNAVALSVDAYVMCSTDTYARYGREYQAALIRHCGHGLMHFHCNRADLAAQVAGLPNLELFQFGGDPQDPVPEIDHLPAMRAAVGDIPIQISCPLHVFLQRLNNNRLQPNVWYCVHGDGLTVDEANRVMDTVRAYRA